MYDSLDKLLASLPEKMREALSHVRPEDAESMALSYLSADELVQMDMAAFWESDGPLKVRHSHENYIKNQDGTPTANDLKGWL